MAGGPLALVKNGDEISFDGPNRTLNLLVDETELARRHDEWKTRQEPSQYTRGYYKLYVDHVLQADEGCDLDFLKGSSDEYVPRESH